jgi:hypothetical protein
MSDFNRDITPLYSQRPLIAHLSAYLLLILFLSITSISYADECGRLIPLYQDSLKQLEVAHKSYLEAGCSEGDHSGSCKRLGTAVREIQGVVHMFMLRLKSLSCTLQTKIKSPCERLLKMIKRAKERVDERDRQGRALKCDQRQYTPPCRALKRDRKMPLNIWRAAVRKAEEAGCSTSKEPLPPRAPRSN